MRPSQLAARLRRRLLVVPGITVRPKCAACEKEHDAKQFDPRSGLCVYCIREYEEWLDEFNSLHPSVPQEDPGPFLEEDD